MHIIYSLEYLNITINYLPYSIKYTHSTIFRMLKAANFRDIAGIFHLPAWDNKKGPLISVYFGEEKMFFQKGPLAMRDVFIKIKRTNQINRPLRLPYGEVTRYVNINCRITLAIKLARSHCCPAELCDVLNTKTTNNEVNKFVLSYDEWEFNAFRIIGLEIV